MLILLIAIPISAVQISQVLYDPLNTEAGEAVQLYNEANATVNISGWVLATEAAAADATLPPSALLGPYSFFIIADAGWDGKKDDPAWPSADYEEAINLYNTDSGVALKDNGVVVDAVGWGDPAGIPPDLFLGTPASPVQAGESLLRISSTGNNADDFIATAASFVQADMSNAQQIELSFEVTTSSSMSFSVEDDKPEQGIQITPAAGKNRTVSLNITVNATQQPNVTITAPVEIRVTFEDITEMNNQWVFEATLSFPFTLPPDNYTITLGTDTITTDVFLTYLPLAAIELDTDALLLKAVQGENASLLGDSKMSTPEKPTIQNVGNVVVDVALSRQPADATLLASVGDNSMSVSHALQRIAIDLAPGDTTPLSFHVVIPGNMTIGTYYSNITLVAVKK